MRGSTVCKTVIHFKHTVIVARRLNTSIYPGIRVSTGLIITTGEVSTHATVSLSSRGLECSSRGLFSPASFL